jgi:acyl dehydratase
MDVQPSGTPVEFPIERGKIAEFARAIESPESVYFDREAARAAGFENVPAPPTYAMVSAFFSGPGSRPRIDIDMRYALHAEQEFEYFAPVVAGDTLTGRTRLAGQHEKQGRRGGTMKFFVLETEYTNQRGEKVLAVRQTLLQTAGTVKE